MMRVRRAASARLKFGLCVCFVALASIQCSRGDRSQTRGSAFTVLHPSDERTWPRSLAFLELALPDENGKWQGRLAKSWAHSPDFRTWTYYLRTNVRWHDGVRVTAHDVKFTFELISHPDVLQRAPGSYTTVVPDDSTFVITYSGGSIPTEPEHWPVILPKHLLKDLAPSGFRNWDFWTRPVGNGPYRYVRHVPKTFMEFEANPDYALTKPKINRVIVKFGPPSVTELMSGNVDAVSHFVRSDVVTIKNDPRFRVYYEVWDDIKSIQTILWNQRNPLFRDSRARRALTLAINRRELLRVLDMWENLPIVDGVYTERQYWQGELPKALPYDRVQASELLDQAGWRDRDASGIRERDGREFSFSLIVTPRWEAAAVYVQAQLRQVGVRVNIVRLENLALRARLEGGQFDAAIAGFSMTVDELDQKVLGSSSDIGYRNPRVTQLLNAARNARDADELDDAFVRLSAAIAEDLPFTILALNVETYVAHRRVKGMSSPFRANPLWAAEHLWIEDDP
ncbi:MAG TPA: ABC transporter substrate-binding protein [Gemmatimonadaceae bacterium]|nr:ABC transporter substrate-binding protein [Gemmatimonadaceae bacterium]